MQAQEPDRHKRDEPDDIDYDDFLIDIHIRRSDSSMKLVPETSCRKSEMPSNLSDNFLLGYNHDIE